MQTITIDDETYRAWEKKAAAQGLTVESWLKETTLPEDDTRPPGDLSPEERLERLKLLDPLIDDYGENVDDSRDTIYHDLGR